jgi:hypothetical protein
MKLLPVSNKAAFNYITHSGVLDEAFPIPADGFRIDKVITCCAKALYFYDRGVKYSGKVKVIAPFMSYQDRLVDNDVPPVSG